MAEQKDYFFYAQEVTRVADISNRKLQYWDETGFISPSIKSQRRRKYSFRDLVLIKLASILSKNGHSIQHLRNSIKRIDEIIPKSGDVPLEKMIIYTDGDNSVIVEKSRYCSINFNQTIYKLDLSELIEMAQSIRKNKKASYQEQMDLLLPEKESNSARKRKSE